MFSRRKILCALIYGRFPIADLIRCFYYCCVPVKFDIVIVKLKLDTDSYRIKNISVVLTVSFLQITLVHVLLQFCILRIALAPSSLAYSLLKICPHKSRIKAVHSKVDGKYRTGVLFTSCKATQ